MKRHFETLDGLRGTAALLVVVFHLFKGFNPTYTANPLLHTCLAANFLFLLSGFVVRYAYDAHWPALRMRVFFACASYVCAPWCS